MEVDNSTSTVMASAGTSGSVSVSLHPLVIMNISEHWTRVRAQEGKPKQGRAFSLWFTLGRCQIKHFFFLEVTCLFVCVSVCIMWVGRSVIYHNFRKSLK